MVFLWFSYGFPASQVTLQYLEAAATTQLSAGRPSPGLLLGQLQPRGAQEAFGAREAAGAAAEEGALGTTTPESESEIPGLVMTNSLENGH